METKDFVKTYISPEAVVGDNVVTSYEEISKICDAFANEKAQEVNLITNEKARLYSENLDLKTQLFLQGAENREITNKLITEIGNLKQGIHKTPIVMKESQNDTAIVIITYNNSKLIKKQIELIRKFHKEPVDIIICDNSTDGDTINQIKYYNDTELKCLYLKTNATSKNGSESHCFAANLSYSVFKNDYKYFLYLDFDCFPTREFSIKELLNDKIIAGMGQNKDGIEYFWPGCVCWNNEKIDTSLIDFSVSHELKLDSGGMFCRIIERYSKSECVFLNEIHVQNPNFNKSMYNFYSSINDGMFLHFLNSSHWNKMDGDSHDERLNSLLNILEEKTNGK